mmetsp:Transcript_82939/g.173655  ORF Transcript_82939/g.173655 Transcript_82939/m.173655 type:complete len:407 (-) Transcript_82939:11-1231(-)
MPRGHTFSSFDEERRKFINDARTLRSKEGAGEQFDDQNRQLFRDFRVDFAHSSEALRDDVTAVRAALSVDGRLLQVCSERLKDDFHITLAALDCTGRALQYASPKFQANKDLVTVAVQRYGGALEHAVDSLRDDTDVVREAVKSTASGLKFSSSRHRASKEIVMLAVKTFPHALEFADEALRADRDVVFAALDKQASNPEGPDAAFCFASAQLKKDKDFVLRAVRSDRKRGREFYKQADQSLQDEVSWLRMWGASRSVLACRGDVAPVVTISLTVAASKLRGQDYEDEGFTCEASLLSGKTFTCHVAEPATLQTTTFPGSNPHTSKTCKDTNSKFGKTTTKLKMNDVAKAVLLAFPQQGQARRPQRVFLVSTMGDREPVAVDAWDWDRQISDYLSALDESTSFQLE